MIEKKEFSGQILLHKKKFKFFKNFLRSPLVKNYYNTS